MARSDIVGGPSASCVAIPHEQRRGRSVRDVRGENTRSRTRPLDTPAGDLLAESLSLRSQILERSKLLRAGSLRGGRRLAKLLLYIIAPSFDLVLLFAFITFSHASNLSPYPLNRRFIPLICIRTGDIALRSRASSRNREFDGLDRFFLDTGVHGRGIMVSSFGECES